MFGKVPRTLHHDLLNAIDRSGGVLWSPQSINSIVCPSCGPGTPLHYIDFQVFFYHFISRSTSRQEACSRKRLQKFIIATRVADKQPPSQATVGQPHS